MEEKNECSRHIAKAVILETFSECLQYYDFYEELDENIAARRWGNFDNPMFHFTSLDKCEKIISSNNVYLFDIRGSNDLSEEKLFWEMLSVRFPDFSFSKKEAEARLNPNFLNGSKVEDYINFHSFTQKNLLNENKVLAFCLADPVSYEIFNGQQTEPYENLAMWRSYANDGKGGCLAFYAPKIRFSFVQENSQLNFLPVIYDLQEKTLFIKHLLNILYGILVRDKETLRTLVLRVPDAIKIDPDSIDPYYVISWATKIASSIFKHPSFSYERESRVFYICSENSTGSNEFEWLDLNSSLSKPYVPLGKFFNTELQEEFLLVNEIIFGPTCTPKDENMLGRKIAPIVAQNKIRVIKSSLPFINC